MFVEISFNVRKYCNPASSPGPPNISAIAAPTVAALSGNSANFAETSCITSNVVLVPVCKSFWTCSDEIPIPSKAAAVAVVISRKRKFASLIASTPLSEKIPILFVWVTIATNWSADIPASLKYAGYSFNVSKNSPFASPPAKNPSLTNCNASFAEIPNCFDNAFVAINVSRKSALNESATACTSFLNAFKSSPLFPVNCCVNLVASTNPAL